jgi:hypothetical protein
MSNPYIEKLQEIPQEKLIEIYQQCFGSEQGKLVLEDLRGRFWEYDSPRDLRECGQYAVLVHIKNMIKPPIGRTEERTE